MVKVEGFRRVVFLVFLFLVLFGMQNHAQQVEHYSSSDGLAHKHVKSIYQDSKGYLWIGTWDGLSKFDGENFTIFQQKPDDTSSIIGSQIEMITGDSSGNVWAVSHQGIMKYSERENAFQRVYLREDYKEPLKFPLTGRIMAFDFNGNGWFVDKLGLISFSTDLNDIHYIDMSELHQNRNKWEIAIVPDSSGLWLSSRGGLFHFTYTYLETTEVLEISASDSSYHFPGNANPDNAIKCIKISTGDFVIRSAPNDIYITDKASGVLQPIDLPPVKGSLMEYQNVDIQAEITPGKLAFSTNNYGILIYNLISKQFEFDHPIQQFTQHQTTYVVYPDRQHNIWVGGLDGLYKYTEPQLNFDSWLYEPGVEKSIQWASVSSIYTENNKLWIASTGGRVDQINLETNQVNHLEMPEKYHKLTRGVNAFQIFGLDSNRLLINYDSVLFVYHISSNRFTLVGTVDYHIYKIYKDREGAIWVSDTQNLFYLALKKDSISLVKSYFIEDHFRDMIQTKNGSFYLATGKGLVNFDKAQFKVLETFVPPGSETSPEVFCIHEASDGMLWLGTIHNGIYCFDPKTEEFTRHFDNKDGLIDNSVNVIFGDDNGYLWMSTWKGIARFDPINETFKNYSTANGLPFPEFNTGAYCQDQAGNYYFGGIGGVIRFHHEIFVNFDIDFTPQITSVIGNGQLIKLDYPLRANEMLNVPYDQNSLNIFFNAFDFRNSNERIYRYRLNGFDHDWKNATGTNKIARYNALNPDIYNFELQSTYKGWDWDDNTVKYLIRVKSPPVFQQQGFQVLLLFLMGLLLLSVVFLRLRNKSLRKEIIISNLECESNKSRLNYLKSQMNPHFYFNTLNAINSFILNNDTRSANKYLTKFARLMREILENSQKDFVTIDEEKNMLENYVFLQELRFPDTFNYSITAEDQVKSKSIPPMLIQPFVENAIEYAFAEMPFKGFLEVQFKLNNENILCSVTDNGIGIENSKVLKSGNIRKSTAIKNIRQRVEMLNKVYNTSIKFELSPVDITNAQFPGTRVNIILPLSIYLSDKS